MRARARRDEDKAARRRVILDAARAEFATTGYGGLTMAAVARRAGLVKGTLYLYFTTKEELLLELVEEQLGGWLDDLERRLRARPREWDARQVVAALSRSLEQREVLVRLVPLVGGVLEHNIPDDRVRRYKRGLQARVMRVAAVLAERVPQLGAARALRFLVQGYALLAGFGEMGYPAPRVRRIIDEPGLELFRVDPLRELSDASLALLEGHLVAAGARPAPRGVARSAASRRGR